jgi:hypothetical protein
MSINEWAGLIAEKLCKKRLLLFNMPLTPLSLISKISMRRFLASEQMVMLTLPHVLSTKLAESIGATPNKSCKEIILDIANHISVAPIKNKFVSTTKP